MPKEGHRVAHKGLDENSGSAKSGVVQEVIGENPALVVVKDEKGNTGEAYVEDELVDLGKKSQSQGPVILSWRHMRALMGQTPVILAMLFTVVSALAIGVIALLYDWSVQAEIVSAVVLVGLALLLIRRLQDKL